MIIIKRYLIFVIILIFLTTIQVYGHFICSRIYNINSELRGSFFSFADFVFASQQLKVTLLKGFVASILAVVELVSLMANFCVCVCVNNLSFPSESGFSDLHTLCFEASLKHVGLFLFIIQGFILLSSS